MKKISLIFLSLTLTVLFLNIGYAKNNQTEPENRPQIIKNITVEEARTIMQNNKNSNNLVIIDVRTPEEFNQEHIQDASNIDFYSNNFKDELDKLDKTKTYVIHCRSGSRSSQALDMMRELGFREVYNMGGIIQWKEKGFPTTK
ncbi:MAG: rhodanese-like domain-containing protein [Thermodesulfobacteriota bacterium]